MKVKMKKLLFVCLISSFLQLNSAIKFDVSKISVADKVNIVSCIYVFVLKNDAIFNREPFRLNYLAAFSAIGNEQVKKAMKYYMDGFGDSELIKFAKKTYDQLDEETKKKEFGKIHARLANFLNN